MNNEEWAAVQQQQIEEKASQLTDAQRRKYGVGFLVNSLYFVPQQIEPDGQPNETFRTAAEAVVAALPAGPINNRGEKEYLAVLRDYKKGLRKEHHIFYAGYHISLWMWITWCISIPFAIYFRDFTMVAWGMCAGMAIGWFLENRAVMKGQVVPR